MSCSAFASWKMDSLYERRVRKNSALPADPPQVVLSSNAVPAKRRYVPPAPTKLHKEIVVDGFQEDMQLSYKSSGRSFYKPGYKMYFPSGALPACGSTATARKDAQGQVYIELNESTEFIITNLIKTCPSLRDTLRRGRVEKIKTNFYPSRSSYGQCRVYINGESKLVPTSSFELDVEQDVFIYPGAVSLDIDEQALKVRLTVAPIVCIHVEPRCFHPALDAHMTLSTTELKQLTESFISLCSVAVQQDDQLVESFQ